MSPLLVVNSGTAVESSTSAIIRSLANSGAPVGGVLVGIELLQYPETALIWENENKTGKEGHQN